jgi:glycosyltransferase involved in cell wall biosynthesis
LEKPIIIATLMRQEGETGLQTHVRSLLDYLQASGQATEVFTPYRAPRWQVYPTFGLRKLIDPLHGAASVWWYRHWHARFLFQALRRRLAGGAPCVIYAQCPVSADAALRARSSPAQRVALVVHFNVSQADEWADKGAIARDGRYFQAIRRFEAATLPRLDGIVYVSAFMRDLVEQRVPAVKRTPAICLPNFLPGEQAAPAGPPPTSMSDLITIGTLEPRKNQAYLLQVLAAAQALGQRFSLDIVGAGPERSSLLALARTLGVAERVHFLGFQSNAGRLIAGHRAYVHAARIENLPVTLVEALRAGVPVLAAPVGGIPEVFDDGVEGRYWDLADAASGARILADVLGDGAAHARMAAAARSRFESAFSSTAVGAPLLRFLRAGV